MTAFTALLKNDFKIFFRDWKAVLLLVAAPFLFIAFFAYALSPYLEKSSFVDPFPIALVDKEDTAQTRMLANQLEGIGIFSEILRVEEEEAKRLISENKAASAIIIPEGFSDSIAVGENKPVTVIGNRSMPLQSYVVKNLAQSAANLVSAGQSAINTIYHYNKLAGLTGNELEEQFNQSTMKILIEMLARNEIFSQVETSTRLDLTPVEYFTAGLIAVFLMFAGMPAMKMLVTERSYGLTRRLNATAVGTWQIILSKFLAALVLSAIQFSVVVILTSIVFNNYWGAPVKSILMLFGAVIFAVSAWSILVSAVSRTPASADVIGNLGILLMAIVGGSIYPLQSMPHFVRYLSRFTVNRWAMDGFMIIFSGNETSGVINCVIALLAIGAAFLALAIGVMRWRRT